MLFGPLNLRELNLNDVSVFLRDSKTPLPLHLDCYPLGGRELYIRGEKRGVFNWLAILHDVVH